MEKGPLGLIPLEAAVASILPQIKPIHDFEFVKVEDSFGRVIAEDIVSPLNIPGVPSASMDGYAIRAGDTAGATPNSPVSLKIVGKGGRLEKGQAMEIMTGEPIPEGADAVIPYEKCVKEGSKIRIYNPVSRNKNVYKVGEKIRKGSLIFRRGEALKPYGVNLLATIGLRVVKVIRRPRVGILSTGSELKELEEWSEISDDFYIINSSRFMLMGLLRCHGAEPDYIGIVKDDMDEIKKSIKMEIGKHDMLITTGGTAIGKKDFVVKALKALGPTFLIHGLDIRPGKPTAIAILNDKPVVMLSGVPEAAFIGFEFIVRPILLKMLRRKYAVRPKVSGRLLNPIPPPKARRVITVNVYEKGGEIFVKPTSVISNGLIVVPKGKKLDKGDKVEAILLDMIESAG